MQKCIAAPRLEQPVEPLLRRHDQLQAQIQAEKATVDNNNRYAEAVRKVRVRMMDRELRALEELGPEEGCQNEEKDEQQDANSDSPSPQG